MISSTFSIALSPKDSDLSESEVRLELSEFSSSDFSCLSPDFSESPFSCTSDFNELFTAIKIGHFQGIQSMKTCMDALIQIKNMINFVKKIIVV